MKPLRLKASPQGRRSFERLRAAPVRSGTVPMAGDDVPRPLWTRIRSPREHPQRPQATPRHCPTRLKNAANRADAQLLSPLATRTPRAKRLSPTGVYPPLPAAPACSEIAPCPRRHGGYTP